VWVVEAARGGRNDRPVPVAQHLHRAGFRRKLDEATACLAAGLKTTYYLRSMGATHAEKSTVKPQLTPVSAGKGCPRGRDRSATIG